MWTIQSSSNGGSDGVCQINQMCSFNLFVSDFLFCDFLIECTVGKKKFEWNFLLLCEVACACRNKLVFCNGQCPNKKTNVDDSTDDE